MMRLEIACLREGAVNRGCGYGILIAVALLGGCDPAATPGSVQFVTSTPPEASSETSITFSPGSAGGPSGTVVVQFNDFAIGESVFGWSWSADGTSWNDCDATMSGCGGSGAMVPMAPNQQNWRGDPGIAADPSQPGVVVATNLANSSNDQGNPNMVVASLSFDGGRTFTSTLQVNDQSCSSGDQDQQAIAFDPTTSPATVWIAWRHNGAAGTGTGTYGACVRGGTVNTTTRTIDWLGDAQDVENLDRTPFYGVGGLLVQAGEGAVTVMYSNSDHIFDDCSSDKQIRWFTVTSFNDGVDWTASHEIYDTDSFDWCSFSGASQNGLRAFGFVRDPGGTYWAAVHDSHESIRVFMSDDYGFTWAAVHRELISPSRSFLFPTLGADASGRILLSFYESDSTDTDVRRAVVAGAGFFDPTSWSGPAPTGVSPFFDAPSGTANRAMGDYDSISAVNPATYPSAGGSFAIAWADSRG